jgi:hypothetical protein
VTLEKVIALPALPTMGTRLDLRGECGTLLEVVVSRAGLRQRVLMSGMPKGASTGQQTVCSGYCHGAPADDFVELGRETPIGGRGSVRLHDNSGEST